MSRPISGEKKMEDLEKRNESKIIIKGPDPRVSEVTMMFLLNVNAYTHHYLSHPNPSLLRLRSKFVVATDPLLFVGLDPP